MPNPAAIGVALVGWGYAASTIHAPLIAATEGLELVGVVSSRHASEPSSLAPALRQALLGCVWFPDVASMLRQPKVQLVVLATPNDTHFPLAQEALAAGKHVVIDKPFALTLAQADALIAQAQTTRRLLTVFHNRRWDSDFLELKQLLADSRLGRVTHVESRFERFRPQVRLRWRESAQAGAGLWYDLGPHLLDQALQLFGEPESIQLHTQHQREGALSDDWFHALLRYPRHCMVLQASMLAAYPGPRWTVHGTQGSYLRPHGDSQEEALKAGRWPASDAYWGQGDAPGGLTLVQPDGVLHQQTPGASTGDWRQFYTQLASALSGRSGEPPVTALQARSVMDWLERGWRSAPGCTHQFSS